MNIYLGTFFIAFSTLALEITLSRLLSVIAWYHLAFFAISTAMLGMTAGAIIVYLKPHWFTREKLIENLSRYCLYFAFVIPLSLVVLCLMPLKLTASIMSFFALVIATVACAVPFFFSGITITAVLTKCDLPIGKLYASDLIGASLGCLFVLGGLEFIDASSLILLCSALGVLAGFCFAWQNSIPRFRWISGILFIVFTLVAVINSSVLWGIRPFLIKGQIDNIGSYHLVKWNSFSRVAVDEKINKPPQLWGPSPRTPRETVSQYRMNIDGLAGTVLRKFSSIKDIKHLRYDVTNMAYYLRSDGDVCIIGVGAGKDIQSAILFGHKKITGIDVNPIFIDLLKNEFRQFAGIAEREGVTLIVDEARSYLSRTKENYSLIQMSLIDTWAATGSGAFTLSENALYTVEAWQIFLNRLKDNGIFTISRWHSQENLGETGRVVSLAVASLLQAGIKEPSRHIAMVTARRISTLLISKQPFNDDDIEKLKKACVKLKFTIAILPGAPPDNKILQKIVSAKSLNALSAAIANEPLNYKPTTDENPYFFNMLRLSNLNPMRYSTKDIGVLKGNLTAMLTLVGLILSLLLVTIATIIVPLLIKARLDRRDGKPLQILWSGAIYFSLIGAGFMLVEIALIQKLSVFLGHPVYALGIVLFTIIASTAFGSFISDNLPLTRFPWIFVYPIVMALAIIAINIVLPILLSSMTASPILNKIAASILLIFPLGVLMGFFFPTGMRMMRSINAANTPWFWALNGVFGVLCSALAVFFSIHFGISTNFYIALVCYAILPVLLYHMHKVSQTSSY